MDGDITSLKEKILELETLLKESKEQIEYYRNIAESSGKKRLKDINQLSGLISEQQKTEKALQKEILFRSSIIKKVAEGLCVFHAIKDPPHMRFTVWNDRMTEITGYTKEKINHLEGYENVFPDPEMRSRIFERISKMFQGEDLQDEEFEFTRKNGDKRTLSISTSVLESGDGITHVLALMYDLTQRKQAERALRASEERLKAIFTAAKNVSFVIAEVNSEQDNNPLITEYSPGSEKIFGYSREEMIGKPVSMIRTQQSAETISEMHKKMRKGQEGFNGEITLIRKSGEKFAALLTTYPLFDDKGEMYGALGVSIDISRQKKLETQFHQGKKLEAIATLAGGIAHEFNNALAGVIGNIELLQMDFENGRIDKYIKPMKSSTFRMARLTSQLLAYAGGGKYRAKVIPLNRFVEDTLPIVQHVIDSEIHLQTNLASGVWSMETDLTQMQMVISAILSNASEAIEDEGQIVISTNNIDNLERSVADLDLTHGPYICLMVEDNGRGMDTETVGRIFEPFFTTKFQGRGLGMAAVYGIIKNHGGAITVSSKLGGGTKICIYLPGVMTEATDENKPTKTMSFGTGTVLIVEDEEIVMDVSRAMLEKLGYRTLEAKNGKEAISISENFDGDIELALLDVKLPDIEGIKLYPFLKKARPNLKVIICSGCAIDGPAKELLDLGADDFLQKPFSITTLSEKLHKLNQTNAE